MDKETIINIKNMDGQQNTNADKKFRASCMIARLSCETDYLNHQYEMIDSLLGECIESGTLSLI